MSATNGGHTCVIVTGGGSGIGLATARRLLEDWPGVRIVSADLHIGEIEKVQQEFSADRVLFVETNVASPEDATRLVASTVAWAGDVSGLVNCAGNSTNVSSLEMTPRQWREIMDVHMDGHFYMNQAVAREMVKRGKGGAIVNFSSVAHLFGWPRRLPYAVSKAGIDALTRTLAVEWAEFGIRVNAIAPGYINTPLVANANRNGYLDPAIVTMHAMGRFGEPNEIANGVKFLLSDDASFITGDVLSIDGGFSIKKISWKK
jgi:NAD(P)-dependent dehydrogenase (short-subunit alcohol dehydrogenase family)